MMTSATVPTLYYSFFSFFYYDESKIVLHQGVSMFLFLAFHFVYIMILKIQKDDGECSHRLFQLSISVDSG